jgi:hypothetical protein
MRGGAKLYGCDQTTFFRGPLLLLKLWTANQGCKHMRQLGMPSTFVDTCKQLYGVSTTDYITPFGSTPYIDINCGTLHGDTLFPFLFTLFLEPFPRWLTVGSRGYHLGAPTTSDDPIEPTATYSGHGFSDNLSLATGSPRNQYDHSPRKALPLQPVQRYDCSRSKILHYMRTME